MNKVATRLYSMVRYDFNVSIQNTIFDNINNTLGCYLYLQSRLCLSFFLILNEAAIV